MWILGVALANDLDRRLVAEGIEWWKKSANLGFGRAAGFLGNAYQSGQYVGVERNAKQSFFWFQKAVDLDDGTACNSLGRSYTTGSDVTVNIEKGLELFRRSADLGYPSRMCNYALTSMKIGIQNKKIGIQNNFSDNVSSYAYWMEKSAMGGIDNAMTNFAGVLYTGMGGYLKNLVESAYWFERAVEKNASLSDCHYTIIRPELLEYVESAKRRVANEKAQRLSHFAKMQKRRREIAKLRRRLQYYHDLFRYTRLTQCANCQVVKSEWQRIKIKKCGGCRDVGYCSVACSKADWYNTIQSNLIQCTFIYTNLSKKSRKRHRTMCTPTGLNFELCDELGHCT